MPSISNCAFCGAEVDISNDKNRTPGRQVFCNNNKKCRYAFYSKRSYTEKHRNKIKVVRSRPSPKGITYSTKPPAACTLGVASCLECPIEDCNIKR